MAKRGWIKSAERIKVFAERNEDISNKGSYRNLMDQLNKVAKHSKGISIPSQRQYYNHMDQFCRFVADNYNLKSLRNIQNKHLVAYVAERQNDGKSAASVKQDIAAIRYFHDQTPRTRYYLKENQSLSDSHQGFSLDRRFFGGVNRRVSDMEYQGLVNRAFELNHQDTAYMLQLIREQGLRVHEATRLNRSDGEKALKDSTLMVKGKGGLVRNIPLTENSREILNWAMARVDKGQKLFVHPTEKGHTVIQRVQDFIRNHREKFRHFPHGRPEGVPVTVHSFRHSYAKEQYDNFLKDGLSEEKARYMTSKLIGHSREDVTRIYLGE